MQEHTKKVLFIIFEAIALTLLTIGTYLGMLGTLSLLCRSYEPLMYLVIFLVEDDPSSQISLIALLLFNTVWFASIKFWPLKNVHIKLVLSSLLIAFSAAFITLYVLTIMFQDTYHRF